MSDWLAILREEVTRAGSIKAVADELNMSRTSISLALAEKYPAKTTKLELLVIDRYQSKVDCPFLRATISRPDCRSYHARKMPQSDPAKLRHWSMCRKCPVGALLAQIEEGKPQ